MGAKCILLKILGCHGTHNTHANAPFEPLYKEKEQTCADPCVFLENFTNLEFQFQALILTDFFQFRQICKLHFDDNDVNNIKYAMQL